MNTTLLNHIDQLRHDALLCAFLSSGIPSSEDGQDLPEDEDDNILAFRGAVGYVTTLSRMRMDLFNLQEDELRRKERREECRLHRELRGEPDCHPLVLEPET
jgi:hypothetical protein